MRVLGIDPGTAIVGYSIMDQIDGKYKLIDYGCVFTSKDNLMPKRLEQIYDKLDTIIKLYKPKVMAIESLFFFKNQKTIIQVGQSRGVINLVAQKNGLDIVNYTPLQVKMAVTGYGRAEKKQIQEMVKVILKLDEIPKPDDAADAIALAITHFNSKGLPIAPRVKAKKNDLKSGAKLTIEEYKKLMNK